MTKRILFVSIAFPPKSDPEAIQAGRYFYQLSFRKDIIMDVVTSSNPTLFMPVDRTLQKYARVHGQLIELPIYEWKYTNFLVRKLFSRWLTRPDSKMTFHWQWRKVTKKLVARPDAVYSRSYPLSSTIMGKKLADYYNVPWVLHLSDPWTENALRNYSSKELDYHNSMELKCFERASLISFTTEKTSILYKKKYPSWSSKMIVFPNVYDVNLEINKTQTELSKSKKFKIVYTGGLANTRTARPILEALHRLYKETPLIAKEVEVLFAGDRDRKNQSLFDEYQLPFVRHMGLLSSDEATALQHSADLLIVIDSKIPNVEKAVFFPSKLLDYAILRIPILAITDKGSVTNKFVNDHGGVCFAHNEMNEIVNWLRLLLQGKISVRMKDIDKKYDSGQQAENLIRMFKSIL